MSNTKSVFQTKADIEKIKLKMSNLAVRTSREALVVMRDEVIKVRDLAMKFAPHKTGFLDSLDSWSNTEEKTGINGRIEFHIKLRNGRWFMRNGRRITLGMYADLMHNGWPGHTPYNLGQGSIDKAGDLGLSASPGGWNYVGMKFLTRAAEVRRLAVNKRLKSALGSIYQ